MEKMSGEIGQLKQENYLPSIKSSDGVEDWTEHTSKLSVDGLRVASLSPTSAVKWREAEELILRAEKKKKKKKVAVSFLSVRNWAYKEELSICCMIFLTPTGEDSGEPGDKEDTLALSNAQLPTLSPAHLPVTLHVRAHGEWFALWWPHPGFL